MWSMELVEGVSRLFLENFHSNCHFCGELAIFSPTSRSSLYHVSYHVIFISTMTKVGCESLVIPLKHKYKYKVQVRALPLGIPFKLFVDLASNAPKAVWKVSTISFVLSMISTFTFVSRFPRTPRLCSALTPWTSQRVCCKGWLQ